MTNAALEIAIGDTLTLLDSKFAEFAAGVANDQYAMWLGSGISLAKFPGLAGVVQTILEHLQVRVDPAPPQMRWRSSVAWMWRLQRNQVALVGSASDRWHNERFASPRRPALRARRGSLIRTHRQADD
ncbi:MAG TPA: hypothetical protein VGC10_04555 [Sphingomonas sp.]